MTSRLAGEGKAQGEAMHEADDSCMYVINGAMPLDLCAVCVPAPEG